MSRFPPPPVSTIDWSNVGFRVREGMSDKEKLVDNYVSWTA